MSNEQKESKIKRFSLKKRLITSTLLTSIFSSILGLCILVGIVGYETHQLFDDILEENSKLLLEGQITNNQQMQYHLDEFNKELELDYQVVSLQGVILNKSVDAPELPFVHSAQKDDKFYNIYTADQFWRIYVIHMPEKGIQIQMAQPWQQRYEYLLPAVGHFLWVMPVLWLLLIIGNWLSIRQSLKPLQQITQQIAQRNSHDLSPVLPDELMQEIEPVVDSINQLLSRLDHSLKAEQQFTADAAHELRTPLAAIQMKLQLLQRRHAAILLPINPELDQLKQDIKRSTSVVENLLLLSRLDPAQSQALPKSNIDIVPLLDELLNGMQLNIDQLQVNLIRDWAIDQHTTIYANKDLLFTALRNVLDNAMRYGGPNVTIKFGVTVRGTRVIFSVQDNGQGVSEQDKLRLSQRFFRILGTEKHGSGLGLSIVQKIVELHQGDMKFIQGLDSQGFGIELSFLNIGIVDK